MGNFFTDVARAYLESGNDGGDTEERVEALAQALDAAADAWLNDNPAPSEESEEESEPVEPSDKPDEL